MIRLIYGFLALTLLQSCDFSSQERLEFRKHNNIKQASEPIEEKVSINPFLILGHGYKSGTEITIPNGITLVTFVAHGSPQSASTFSDNIYLLDKARLKEVLHKSNKTKEPNVKILTINNQSKRIWIYEAGDKINNYTIKTNDPIEDFKYPIQGRCNSMMKTGLYSLPLHINDHDLFFSPYSKPQWKTHSSETYCYKRPKPAAQLLAIFPDAIVQSRTAIIAKARKGSLAFGQKDRFSLEELLTELQKLRTKEKPIVLFYGACRS